MNFDHMPDIAHQGAPSIPYSVPLDQVGMSEIPVTLNVDIPGSLPQSLPAVATAFVSLDDPKAKGIHMSRLFLHLQQALATESFNIQVMREALTNFVKSHAGLSESAFLSLKFKLPLKRKALLSQNVGWKHYPVKISGKLHKGDFRFELTLRVTYSSTCPCSAALARQLIQKRFHETFGKESSVSTKAMLEWLGTPEAICATPHGQRSHGDIRMKFTDGLESLAQVVSLIDDLENALKTPVQTAVKREDEQEFARLNGENLMFAEDAVRRMAQALDKVPFVSGYRAKASHLESLHAHNAVAVVAKGFIPIT